MNISTHIWCEWLSKTLTPSGRASKASSSLSRGFWNIFDNLVFQKRLKSTLSKCTWILPISSVRRWLQVVGKASVASSSFSSFSLQHFNDALVSCAASATWKTPFKPQQHSLCFCLLLSLFKNKFSFSCILYNIQCPFFPLPRSIRKSSFTPIAMVYKICQNPHIFDNLFKEHGNYKNV